MPRVIIYRTYRFLDKDPLIDAMRTVVKDELKLTDARAHAITGVAGTTFHNWFEGETKRPQNATASAAMAGLGYVRRDELTPDGQLMVGFVRASGTKLDYQQEIKKQADWLLKQGRRAKKRKQTRRRPNAK